MKYIDIINIKLKIIVNYEDFKNIFLSKLAFN